MSEIDFDGTLTRLLDLNGAEVQVTIEPEDLSPPLLAHFGGTLTATTSKQGQDGRETLHVCIDPPAGRHKGGAVYIGQDAFDSAEYVEAPVRVLTITLGSNTVTIGEVT